MPAVTLGSTDEKGKYLVRLINRFSLTLRQSCAGEYRDEITTNNPDVRIQYKIHCALKDLKHELALNVPDLDGEDYQARLNDALASMRGRELPGFASTRLLLSTVSSELDTWRTEVEEGLLNIFGLYSKAASGLAQALSDQFPALEKSICELIQSNCDKQFQEMGKKIEDMFLRSTETAAGDNELIRGINHIRSERFETTLKEVLLVAKDPNERSDSNSQTQHHNNTNKKYNHEMSTAELKQHVLEMLGSAYMTQHGLGYGPNLHPDDARTALKAYWRVSYGRLNEDIAAAVELLLLQRCTEMIENDLLAAMQQWLTSADEIDKIMSEGEVTQQQTLESQQS